MPPLFLNWGRSPSNTLLPRIAKQCNAANLPGWQPLSALGSLQRLLQQSARRIETSHLAEGKRGTIACSGSRGTPSRAVFATVPSATIEYRVRAIGLKA